MSAPETARDHRSATIRVGDRVQIAMTPAGPRGVVIAIGIDGGVLVRWQGGREIWETPSGLEIA